MPLNPLHVLEAQNRIAGAVHRTPVMTSTYFNQLIQGEVLFKCENLQKVGAFKARGALNAVRLLTDDEARRGVLTHSSGNHGQAVAWAAQRRGIAATVVMPKDSAAVKIAAVQGYGAQVHFSEPGTAARETATQELLRSSGAVLIHPYDDERVIAGQGTAALELLQHRSDLDFVLAPVGGGGLLSGTVLARGAVQSKAKIYGAEPLAVDDAFRTLRAGTIQRNAQGSETIADGLRSSAIGETPFAIIKKGVFDIITVTEQEIVAALRTFMERTKLVIEPSAAVPIAALIKNPELFSGQKVGVIVSGGNIDLAAPPWLDRRF